MCRNHQWQHCGHHGSNDSHHSSSHRCSQHRSHHHSHHHRHRHRRRRRHRYRHGQGHSHHNHSHHLSQHNQVLKPVVLSTPPNAISKIPKGQVSSLLQWESIKLEGNLCMNNRFQGLMNPCQSSPIKHTGYSQLKSTNYIQQW
ncbi:PREDICTED: knob-associated histidine-rich protein-like [Colobus angolensis palliatus]|uniref:knob-associated histidine-rich protein-like n=1 Tax=Colobus angolensis palliatus TaxID=336983 RepID=UPI0005F48107|nr:PREDICTED: knob-associated histidine-rich protein-like [Colobus angolensis palliatus]